MGDLDWPEIDVLFLVSEGDASCGKPDDCQENEQSSDDGCWFHVDGDDLSCVYVRVIGSDAYVVGNRCIDQGPLEPAEIQE